MIELHPPIPRRSREGARASSGLVATAVEWHKLMFIMGGGVAAGLVMPSFGALKQPLLLLVFGALCAAMFGAFLRGKLVLALAVVAYLSAMQPVFRLHVPVLPYFALQYVMLPFSVFLLQLKGPQNRAVSIPSAAYGAYVVLELAGILMSTDMERARAIALPSLTMFTFLMAARKVRVNAGDVTFLLASYVAGASALFGFAIRSYLAGQITWGTESNFEASGGMPPNHISLLCSLGAFACLLLAEQTARAVRIVFLVVATSLGGLMVLSFSRGGTVILVVCAVLYYVILRQRSLRTVLILFVIAGIGLVTYYGTLEITGGKVAERYAEVNTSNRIEIATQGLGIFFDNPLLGVGTANFNQAITQTEFGRTTGAHNELVRAAAEHGIFGLVIWVLFAATSAIAAFRRGDDHRARRALRLVIWIFAITSMFYNGLKLMVQPLLLLLALTAFTAATPDPSPPRPPQ